MRGVLQAFWAALLLTATGVCAEPLSYNPAPLEDDVLVSMPGGCVMAFRKIYTSPGRQRLSDKIFMAGREDEDKGAAGLAQSLHQSFIQGALQDERGLYYLMAKYELTEGQRQALMTQRCPLPDEQMLLPAASLSWFEAVDLSRRYSLYLQRSADAPRRGTQRLFARLPTDSEWEYAAHGGLSNPGRGAANPERLREQAWCQGTQSAAGKAHRVGLLKPNALGLYDMLGNVEEMILEPYRAVRSRRLHGQSGGFIARGGSYLTPESELSAAYRVEKPYFVGAEENRASNLGVRLVLGALVGADPQELRELNAELGQIPAPHRDPDAAPDDSAEPNLFSMVDDLIALNEEMSRSFAVEHRSMLNQKAELNLYNQGLQGRVEMLDQELGQTKDELVQAMNDLEDSRLQAVTGILSQGAYLCRELGMGELRLERENKEALRFVQLCRDNPRYCDLSNEHNAALRESTAAQDKLRQSYLELLRRYAAPQAQSHIRRYHQAALSAVAAVPGLGEGALMFYNHVKGFDPTTPSGAESLSVLAGQCQLAVQEHSHDQN